MRNSRHRRCIGNGALKILPQNLRAGYFTGPPSLTVNDETLNKTSTVYISLPDFFGDTIRKSSNERLFGQGSTMTAYRLVNDQLEIAFSAKIKLIVRNPNSDILKITFDELSFWNWMKSSELYQVRISGIN